MGGLHSNLWKRPKSNHLGAFPRRRNPRIIIIIMTFATRRLSVILETRRRGHLMTRRGHRGHL